MNEELNEAMINFLNAVAKQPNKSGEANMLDTIKKLLGHPQISYSVHARNLLRVVCPAGDLHHLLESLLNYEDLEYVDRHGSCKWRACENSDLSFSSSQYRIKPETIKVGDIEINAPYREAPPIDTLVYIPFKPLEAGYYAFNWSGTEQDFRELQNGFCFKTAKDAVAAKKAISKLMTGGVE